MSDFEASDVIGIFQGDLIIKAMVELSLEDMRKNSWVIEDVFRSLVENPMLKQKYGWKEVTRAKEFIINNDIPVYMRHRLDKQEFPCITISIGNSEEDKSLATLGDTSPYIETFEPCDIWKPIPYVVQPFDPVSYDSSTGIVEVPTDIEEYRFISKGMLAVDPETGNAFIINDRAGTNGFSIDPGSELPKGKIAIVPQFPIWNARRERAISQEHYNIGCHAQGDPSTLIFLYAVVKYSLFRYRESLLEANNFQLSNLSSTDMIKNDSFGVENIYSRWISLSGQVEESWLKSPMRTIESMDFSGSREGENLEVGIKILSSAAPEGVDEEDDVWVTIDE